MKKLLLLGAIALGGITANAQLNYCTPSFADGCSGGDRIDDFKISSVGFEDLSTGCADNQYDDRTSIVITLQAGVSNNFVIKHSYTGQKVKIWVDLNNDGVFEDTVPELISSGQSTNTKMTSGIIKIPEGTAFGEYRMRVATKNGTFPTPCNTTGFGEAHDYTVSIADAPSCQVPEGFSNSNPIANTVNVSWDESTSVVAGYTVYYSPDNIAPTDTTELNDTNSVSVDASTTATLTGLMPETTYYAWVRANCSDTDSSGWSLRISFVTGCELTVPNYTENFDSLTNVNDPIELPCWTVAKGGDAAMGYTSTGTSQWRGRNFLENESNSKAPSINLYSTSHKDWLISPVFDLSGGTEFELTFDYGVTHWNNQEASDMGADDYVQLLVSIDGGVNWTVVETWDTSNAPSNTSTTYNLDLTPYISNHTVIAFYATDGDSDNAEDYSFFVDNFAVTTTGPDAGTINQELTSLNVYPNPATDIVNISNDAQITNVEVYDINGRRLFNKNVGKISMTIDVSSLATGTYFVKVTSEGKTSTKQIIVK